MYLEISGRRTGKTTRMLTAIHKAYMDGERIAVFVPTYGMGNSIRKAIEENNYIGIEGRHTVKVYYIREDFDKRLLDTGLLIGDFKLFYEEFDYFRGNNKVIVSEDGYYVTTPCKIRTDFNDTENDVLLKLIDMNAGSYVKHINKELADSTCMDEHYKQEIIGEFI